VLLGHLLTFSLKLHKNQNTLYFTSKFEGSR